MKAPYRYRNSPTLGYIPYLRNVKYIGHVVLKGKHIQTDVLRWEQFYVCTYSPPSY